VVAEQGFESRVYLHWSTCTDTFCAPAYSDRVTDHPHPVWRDPLLQPPPPVGTGTGAYVEAPEPRANPMTIEGEIAAFGEMARGAVKRGGWSGVMARAFMVTMLLFFLVSLVLTASMAFR